jgi:hypothetical protein
MSLTLRQVIIWYRDIGQYIANYEDDKSTSAQKKDMLIKDLINLLEYPYQTVDYADKIKKFTWIEERQMWIYTPHYLKNKESYDTMLISNETIHKKMMEDVSYDLDGCIKVTDCAIM